MKFVSSISDEYKLGKELGKGAFGTVHRAVHMKHGLKCAIKIIAKKHIDNDERNKKQFLAEVDILMKVKHQHLAHTYEVLHDAKNYYIVAQLALQGDLLKFYTKRQSGGLNPLCENQVRFVAKQLLSALNDLHQ